MGNKNRFWRWLANRMPKQLTYFCAMRVAAFATSGDWSDERVPELTAMTALDRWDRYK